MGHVTVENLVWQNQQKPSLVVVLGSTPAYNPTNDVFKLGKHAQFHVATEIQVSQRTWQLSSNGAVGFYNDFRITNAKVFTETNPPWTNEYKPTPRLVTDFIQNADIFISHDTIGWPEYPYPPFWVNEGRGTPLILQTFIPYNPVPDVFLRRPQDKFFAPEQVVWNAQPVIPQSVFTTYIPYANTAQQPNAKFFADAQVFIDFSQRVTQNVIFNFSTYNPATDPLQLHPPTRWFDPQALWWDSTYRVTANARTFLPPPYVPGNDPTLKARQTRFDNVVEPTFINPQIPYRVTWDVPPFIPPILPGVPVVFNWQGRVVLSPKKVGEKLIVPVDFISRLAAGETILTATVASTVYSGTDPNPGNILVGVPALVGTVVEQEVIAGALGTTYELLYTANTSLGQTLQLSGYFSIVPDLP